MRFDAVILVVLHLNGAAATRLVNGQTHGIGDLVGVHQNLARHITRRTPDGLNERAMVAQEAFLVCVKNGDKRHLGQVKALAQQVDAHQRVELAHAQIAQDLDTVERGDVRMHVSRANTLVK